MRQLAIFIAVVTVVFVFSGLSSADLNDGLVAYYPFNGNANDESGNGNDGVVDGATLSEDKSGIPGRAYSFDGDDKIVIPNSTSLKFGINSFSISFWIKTSANKWCYVLDKDHSNAPSGFYRFRFSGGESDPNIHFQIGDAAHCCTSTEAINTTDIIDGNWHHIVGVRDTTSGVLQIYLDGSLESTEIDNTISSTDNNYPLVFGGPSASNNSYFEGKLDEIRMYSRALSEEQIIELFSYQSQPNKGFNAKGYFRNFDNLGLITWENTNTAQIQIKDQYGDIRYSTQVDNTYHVWLPSNFIDENTQFSVNKIGDKAIWQNFQKPPENVIMWAHEKEIVSVLYDSLTALGGWLWDLYGTVGSLKTSIVILPPGVLNFLNSYSFGPHSEDGMRFVTACPFDAILIDPDGLILSNSVNQLSGSAVFAEYDVFNNDDPIELALISQMKKGEYRIQISPEDSATSSSVFSLLIDEYSYGVWVNTFAKMDQNIGLGEQFSEYTYLANSTNSVDLIAAFVTRFYNLCLDRNPDQPGLYGWISALMDGSRTGSDVAYGFSFSPEFLNKNTTAEEYITILYEAFFNRKPDSAGFQGWLDAMQNGASREDVLNGFIHAQEFANLCDEYGIKAFPQNDPVSAFVTRFYQLCLDRDPDVTGLKGWTNNLLNQIQTGADVAIGFIYSHEFIKKNTANEEYLTILYEAFFNRDPDQAGWDVWISELNGGKDRGYVLNGFLGSQEFIKLCEDYGIVPN